MATKPEGDTSLSLLERVQSIPPDPEAWETFVRRYHPLIHAWCVKWGLQVSDADDVAQEVELKLLAVMRRFEYDPSRSFSAWLKVVTHNMCTDFYHDLRRLPGPVALDLSAAEIVDARGDLEHELRNLFDRDMFETALRRVAKRVKPVTWDAFRLTALEGLSGQVAAQRLDIPIAHVFVAKNRVQKLLQEEITIMKANFG